MQPEIYAAIRKAHANHGLDHITLDTVGDVPNVRRQVVGKGIKEYHRFLLWKEQKLIGEPRPPGPRAWQTDVYLMVHGSDRGDEHAVE